MYHAPRDLQDHMTRVRSRDPETDYRESERAGFLTLIFLNICSNSCSSSGELFPIGINCPGYIIQTNGIVFGISTTYYTARYGALR